MIIDLITQIIEHLSEDYDALYRCSLVSRACNVEASRQLYRRVVISPPFRRATLDLRKRGHIEVSIIFQCIPSRQRVQYDFTETSLVCLFLPA
jgi:hypothetical protein